MKEKRPIQVSATDPTLYLIAAKTVKTEQLPELYFKRRDLHFDDFIQFTKNKRALHVVKPSTVWSEFYSCTCTEGSKKRPCKHATWVMELNKLVTYPPRATAELIGQKRGPGRPKKATQALLRG